MSEEYYLFLIHFAIEHFVILCALYAENSGTILYSRSNLRLNLKKSHKLDWNKNNIFWKTETVKLDMLCSKIMCYIFQILEMVFMYYFPIKYYR